MGILVGWNSRIWSIGKLLCEAQVCWIFHLHQDPIKVAQLCLSSWNRFALFLINLKKNTSLHGRQSPSTSTDFSKTLFKAKKTVNQHQNIKYQSSYFKSCFEKIKKYRWDCNPHCLFPTIPQNGMIGARCPIFGNTHLVSSRFFGEAKSHTKYPALESSTCQVIQLTTDRHAAPAGGFGGSSFEAVPCSLEIENTIDQILYQIFDMGIYYILEYWSKKKQLRDFVHQQELKMEQDGWSTDWMKTRSSLKGTEIWEIHYWW